MAYDVNKLFTQLQITGLQNKDPSLFQLINLLIRALGSAQSEISGILALVNNTTNNTVESVINQYIIGDNSGGDSSGGDVIPGPQGIQGVAGSAGATGPQGVMAYYGLDGEDGETYPSQQGPQGNPGTTGSVGGTGASIPYDEVTEELSIILLGSQGNSSSGWVLLAEQIASGSASLDFTTRNKNGLSGNLFQSDFDEYMIELIGIIPATNNVGIGLRVRVAGVFISTGSYAWTHWVYGPAGTGQNAATAQTEVRTIGFVNASNVGTFSVNGGIRLLTPLSTALHKVFGGQIHFWDTGPSLVVDMFSGAYSDIPALDGLQVLATSGNLASGTIRIYGVSK